jgi:hypothetical protein
MPQVIFTVLTPIFLVMALGYFAGRMRTIDNHHVGEINALVMDFALPAATHAKWFKPIPMTLCTRTASDKFSVRCRRWLRRRPSVMLGLAG